MADAITYKGNRSMVPLKNAFIASCLISLVTGCTQAGNTAPKQNAAQTAKIRMLEASVVSLRAENEKLASENEKLRLTPSALLADVNAAVDSDDEAKSNAALKRLVVKFPDSAESVAAAKRVATLVSIHRTKALEKARLLTLGFKALKVSPTFSGDDASIKLAASSKGTRWTFDAYGDEWRYLESERGEEFVTAKVTISSKMKNPRLMGVGVYLVDGDRLKRIGMFDYRFARWDDFASYLGNNADYRNDFSHSGTIPFSIGASIKIEEMNGTLYLIATKEGCFSRSEDRFGRPPVMYISISCESLPASLALSDFADGKLGILKRVE